MALTVSGFVHCSEINSAVRNVEDAFSPQVVRFRHSVGEDQTGTPSIFF